MQIVKYLILNLAILLSLSLSAQTQGEDIMSEQEWEAEVGYRIHDFIDELNQLTNAGNLRIRISEANIESGAYTRMLSQKLRLMNNQLQSIEFRWNAFTQSEQAVIANNDELMALMAQAQQLKQAVADTIEAQQKRCDAITDFVDAERLILSQDSVYKKLYKKAQNLSMVQKLAPQLEKVKGEEQALFEKIQISYDKSKAAATTVPVLSKRAAVLDEKFYKIKALSEKIQAMEYKPFLQRIKDYLLGFACVAIILMFVSTFSAKLKAAKQAREMLKKQKDLFNKNNGNDYPTI